MVYFGLVSRGYSPIVLLPDFGRAGLDPIALSDGHILQFRREPIGVGRPEMFWAGLKARRKYRRVGGPAPMYFSVVTI